MSDEKNPSTEESPETRPEVTGEVTTAEGPGSSEEADPSGAPETEPETATDPEAGDDSRPEATGEVTVEPEPPDDDEVTGEPDSGEALEAEPPADGGEEPEEGSSEEAGESSESSGEQSAEERLEETPDDSPAPEDTESGSETGSEEPAKSEEAASGAAEAEAPQDETTSPDAETPKPKPKRKRKRKRKKKPAKESPPVEESPAVAALREAKEEGTPVEGRVFGWNKGGFHVVVGDVPAFCPRSEMEADGNVAEPEKYVDETLEFLILRIQDKGRRVVLSRSALEKREQHLQRAKTLKELSAGSVTRGTVSSIVDFGAFVELGGVEGLVHRSELTRRRYDTIEDVVEVGQEVEVKVLKIEKGGRRISLSMKALEPDPWKDVQKRFPEGEVVSGTVEHTAPPGAFIELEPGLTGLLPTSEMNIPREAIPARIFPPGKEVKVVVMSLDPRRRRISLALEGSKPGASHKELTEFRKSQKKEEAGFGALAAAFAKLGNDED